MRSFGFVIGILANAIGGATYILQKIALEGWPPSLVILLRLLIALPFFWMTCPRGSLSRATRADWIRMIGVGIFGLAAPLLVGIYGLRDTESLNGAILIGMEPVTIALLSWIVLGERLDRARGMGILAAIAGASLIVSKGRPAEVFDLDPTMCGNLLLMLHGMLWAIYTLASKPTLERVPPIALSFVTSAIAAIAVAPAAILEWPLVDLAEALAPAQLCSLSALGFVASYAAAVLWNMSLARITAIEMAVLIFFQPLAGTLLGLASGEPLYTSTLEGGLLILAGAWMTQRPR